MVKVKEEVKKVTTYTCEVCGAEYRTDQYDNPDFAGGQPGTAKRKAEGCEKDAGLGIDTGR